MQKWEKDLNNALEKGLISLGYGIKNFAIGVFYGAKKLKERKFLIGFIVSIFIMILTLILKTKITLIENFVWKYLIYYAGLAAPVIYLKIISSAGMKQGNELIKRLEDYKFYGVDGKLPIFLGQEKDDFGLEVLKFQAALPLKTWKSSREDLESLFNRTIVSITQDSRKDRVLLKTIPGSVEIPKSILWKDEYINNEDGVVVIGRNAVREISFDLNKTPHVLSAGETGSGKSVILRLMLWQLLNKGCVAYMIDFKGGVGAKRWFEILSEMVIGIA